MITKIKLNDVASYKVHSVKTRTENVSQLKKFSFAKPKGNEIHILVAVDMLNEGIDIPMIDSVMLFRRTESPRIYLQQIGRSIRKHGVETPLIFDCVLNYRNVNINFIEESRKEFDSYRKKLEEFGFTDIDVPKTIHIHDELQNISKIIEEVEKRLNFYPTYEEAKQTVKKREIRSITEYRKRYKEDPRLPSEPYNTYDGKGWIDSYDFFGKHHPYSIYEEAKEAVEKLGITSPNEYKCGRGKEGRYREDPRLPSHPNDTYEGKGWESWSGFFERDVRELYTYEEAREFLIPLKVASMPEYYKLCEKNPRLPSNPDKCYKGKGWINLYEYTGRVKSALYTYKEAKEINIKNDVNSWNDYKELRKKDPRLPSTPNRTYKAWISKNHFFGIEDYYTYKEAKQIVNKANYR
ncbi:MAG: integrase repeat-containing protein [Candidatus Anammoxibacter sp.]